MPIPVPLEAFPSSRGWWRAPHAGGPTPVAVTSLPLSLGGGSFARPAQPGRAKAVHAQELRGGRRGHRAAGRGEGLRLLWDGGRGLCLLQAFAGWGRGGASGYTHFYHRRGRSCRNRAGCRAAAPPSANGWAPARSSPSPAPHSVPPSVGRGGRIWVTRPEAQGSPRESGGGGLQAPAVLCSPGMRLSCGPSRGLGRLPPQHTWYSPLSTSAMAHRSKSVSRSLLPSMLTVPVTPGEGEREGGRQG